MNDNAKQLLKVLMGAGLTLLDSGRREKATGHIKDRVDDWSDVAREKYEDVVDRLDRVSDALRGRERWTSKLGTFLLGLGVGVGVGMLFAPASGEETRNTISEQASNIRDRVTEQASNIRDRVSEHATNLKEQATNLKEKVRDTVRRESGSGEGSSEQQRMPRPA
jgi:gas vesicle protein